jgi:integrase
LHQPLKIEQSRRADPKMETFGQGSTLTIDEVERLIEAVKINRHGLRDALMVLLAFRHGLRAGEVVDLRWEQVDFKTASLHVRRLKNGVDPQHGMSLEQAGIQLFARYFPASNALDQAAAY